VANRTANTMRTVVKLQIYNLDLLYNLCRLNFKDLL